MSVRCLIVDDDREFLRAASHLLERDGITVAGVVSTATQALLACRDLRPDVVLLDVQLGEATGFDVAQLLIAQCGQDERCIILISAYSAADFEDMISEVPAISFLPKEELSPAAVLGILHQAQGPVTGR